MFRMRDGLDEKIYKMAGREHLPVPEELSGKIEDIIQSQTKAAESRQRSPFYMPRAAIPAALLVLTCSVTVSAAVSMYRKRMEEMNQEKLEEYFSQVYSSTIQADTYNRELTAGEKERLEELETAYRNEGLFPEGEIRLLDSREDYSGDGVGYYATAGTFYFPESELSDEELLQLIDFRNKRDYSIQKLNQDMASGELAKEEILDGIGDRDEVTAPVFSEQETIIPYTGDLSITAAAAGDGCIYLAGYNEIHKMGMEESSSEVFYDDFEEDTWIKCMYQAQDGLLYAAVSEEQESGIYAAGILVLDGNGNFVKKIGLSDYYEDPNAQSSIFRMAVDPDGYIYLQGMNIGDSTRLMVIDPEGKNASVINLDALEKSDEESFLTDPRNGICVGKDGKVYIWFERGDKKGIASVDRERGTLSEIYELSYDGIYGQMDVIARGNDSDFVFWGYDGMYTWSIGDEKAECVYKSYEKNYSLDGALACAADDGRILVVDCVETEENADSKGGQAYLRIPEKTVFYYEADVK